MSEEIARAFVRILADTSEFKADAAAKIRAAMAGLHPTVDVGADTGEAEAKLAAFDIVVRQVGAESPSVRVDADTAAAEAQLAAVGVEAEALARENPTVRVDSDTSNAESTIAGLWSWVAALGPIAIPVVAAGAGGIAGIAAALGAAGAAAGTAYLGFSGVTKAVKDMGTESAKAGQQAVHSGGAQVNSAQQIQLAEMSLANARANASDQAVAAEERLANAERQEHDAQVALTQARQAAQTQLEQYNLQLEDAALAQKQSLLDIATAKQSLDQTLANPKATELQREQARLSYEEAVQHNKDLQFQNEQLRKTAADAAKAGVDGNSQVVAAQERLDQATQAVGDAQRAQAAQQRQSALAVAQAQAAVANAMRTSGGAAATTDATVNKLNADLANLAPAGQEFARFIYGLRGDLAGLRFTAEQGLLPGVEDGIKAVLPLLPQLDAFVGQVASSMGSMADADLRALNTPFWRQFFDYVSRNAVPTLTEMNDVLGNSAHGWAGLLMAFQPVEQQMGAGLERMSRDFASFGEHAGTNSEFQHFLSYVETNGPLVVHTIGDIGRAAGSLLAAAAPLGPPLLQVVDVLARLVSMNPTLVALGIEWFAWNRVLSSLSGSLQSAARFLGLFGAAQETAAAKAATSTAVMEESAAATAASARSTQESGKAAGAAAGGFNPLVAVIAALTLGTTYAIGQTKQLADQQRSQSDQAYATARTAAQLTSSLQAQADAAAKAGDNLNPLSWRGYDDAMNQANQQLENVTMNLTGASHTLGLSKDATLLLARAAGVDLREALVGASDLITIYVENNYKALTGNRQLTGTILAVDAAVYEAKDGWNAYDAALSAVVQTTDNAYSSHVDFKQSLSDMTKQLRQNSHSFNENTDAGRANIRIVNAGKDAAERDAAAAYKSAYASSKLTNETDKRREATAAANAVLNRDVQSLIAQGEKAGYSRDQMQHLLEKMGLLSKTPATAHVGTSGVGATSKAINDVISQLHYINDHPWYATVVQNVLPPGAKGAPHYVAPAPPATGDALLGQLLNPTPRAAGGSFDANQLLLLGEGGREIVSFDQPGKVIPNAETEAIMSAPARGSDDTRALIAAQRQTNTLLARIAAAAERSPAALATALNTSADQARHKALTTVRRP